MVARAAPRSARPEPLRACPRPPAAAVALLRRDDLTARTPARAAHGDLPRLLRAAVAARDVAGAEALGLPPLHRRRILARAFDERTYYLRGAGGKRTLHVDTKAPVWGGTVDGRQHDQHVDPAKPRAILYETISTIGDGFNALQNRLSDLTATSLWDTGLSVVLNMAYTPSKTYDERGTATKKAATKGNDLDDVKRRLNDEHRRVTQHWAGPPMNIVVAAWERREREANKELETVQSAVPYTTLRVIAATDDGAAEVDTALRANHDHVWHKMGDNDMPIFDPNPLAPSDELRTLGLVEDEALSHGNVLVTFGYNLTTPGAQGPVREALEQIYTTEMELRDRIATLKVPMYPSEPTTFYRPVRSGSMQAAWNVTEDQVTGGSGQQLEGAKLAKALKAKGGYKHFTFHSTKVDTAAGGRNDRIVELLNGWWNNGAGDPDAIDWRLLDAEINKLDQSALRDKEYVEKVLGNLGHPVSSELSSEIAGLVTSYRKRAAEEAALKVYRPLSFRRMWQRDVGHKYAKLGF